jgi:uncharacterized membrane protein HdeD (DUF308 family)
MEEAIGITAEGVFGAARAVLSKEDASMGTTVKGSPIFFGGWHDIRQNRGWLITLGVVSIILGVIALVDSIAATVASMIVLGWVLLIAGIIEGVQAFRHRQGGHLFLHLLNAVLSFVVGLMLLRNPLAGALLVTLLLATYFVVIGIFRIVASLSLRVPHWGWAMANGIVTLIFGIVVWAQWPVSGLWVIGLFIGIDLIFLGWTEVMLGLAARQLPQEPE